MLHTILLFYHSSVDARNGITTDHTARALSLSLLADRQRAAGYGLTTVRLRQEVVEKRVAVPMLHPPDLSHNIAPRHRWLCIEYTTTNVDAHLLFRRKKKRMAARYGITLFTTANSNDPKLFLERHVNLILQNQPLKVRNGSGTVTCNARQTLRQGDDNAFVWRLLVRARRFHSFY